MQLEQLAKAMNTTCNLDAELSGLALDSREAKSGSLFFAIAGSFADGHDYVQSAFERGSVAAVVSKSGLR